MIQRSSLTRKVNAIILLSLIAGLGGIIAYFSLWILRSIDNSTSQNLRQQSEILYKTIENIMLPGEAPIAQGYFADINTINPDYNIRVFRRNGQIAFQDNTTLADVDKRLGFPKFALRATERVSDSSPIESYFKQATALPSDNVFFKENENGISCFRIYKPLLNLPECTVCHGSDHTIRGVVDIRNNISTFVKEQTDAFLIALFSFVGLVGALTLILTLYIRSDIIKPVKQIAGVCADVTTGNFDRRVTVKNRDEIGFLGATVNQMVEGLHERFKLSKYVSSSTIQSLSASEQGHKENLTIFFSDVRSFTAHTEIKPPEEVVQELNRILEFQTDIIQAEKGDVDKYVGDEIVAIFSGKEGVLAACRAAVRIQAGMAERGAEFGSLKVGIGINTGGVILGMVGSEKRADYTVIGDTVNVTSRLCAAAKPGTTIIIDAVFKAAAGGIQCDGPYRIKVKGKADFLKVYLLKSTN